MQMSRTTIPTIASALIGIAGILLNCISAYIVTSDRVLGVLVFASIAMIATGYLPALKQWKGQRWATGLMNVAIAGFIVYAACAIGS